MISEVIKSEGYTTHTTFLDGEKDNHDIMNTLVTLIPDEFAEALNSQLRKEKK